MKYESNLIYINQLLLNSIKIIKLIYYWIFSQINIKNDYPKIKFFIIHLFLNILYFDLKYYFIKYLFI